jgi:hypothetical protein
MPGSIAYPAGQADSLLVSIELSVSSSDQLGAGGCTSFDRRAIEGPRARDLGHNLGSSGSVGDTAGQQQVHRTNCNYG